MHIVVSDFSNCLWADRVRIFNKYLAKRSILVCMFMNQAMKSWIGFLLLSPPFLLSPQGSKLQLHWNYGYHILALLSAFYNCRNRGGITELLLYSLSNSAKGIFFHLHLCHLYTFFFKFLCSQIQGFPQEKCLSKGLFFQLKIWGINIRINIKRVHGSRVTANHHQDIGVRHRKQRSLLE